jgi:hypothetical protein
MILGTCNFNNLYNGIKIEKEMCFKLLDCFYSNNGKIIDTAFNYGKSHEIIKEWLKQNPNNDLKVITKIWKQEEFFKCFDDLGIDKIYCIMTRENNLSMIEFLKDQQQKNLIEKFGISCYLPTELTTSYFNCIEIPTDPCWFNYIPIISLYANVYMRSYYNHFIKNYEYDYEFFQKFEKIRLNKKVDMVIGCDNIKQLKENLRIFK